jgi:alpha-tubulin suppressor-like RCC1 family protein
MSSRLASHHVALLVAIPVAVFPGLTHGQRIAGIEIDRAEFIVSTMSPDGNRTSRETNRVPLDPYGACYEWRLHFSTNTLGELAWREEFELPAPGVWQPSDGYEVRGRVAITKKREIPKDGWIGQEWCVGEGDPAGKYVITVYIQDSLARSFEFLVEDSVVAEVLGQHVRLSQWRQAGGIIFSALLDHYVKEHRIAPTQDEITAFHQRFPEFPGTEEEAWTFLQTWKVKRALFIQYGGRVVLQQAGPEPIDAYRDFLKEQEQRGSFRILDERLRPSFWDYYVNDSRHDFIPPEEARGILDKPWQEDAAPAQAQGRGPTQLTFAAVSVGGIHTCGLTAAGAAYCWGWNSRGQLGDGTSANERSRPVRVGGDASFTALSAGDRFTCGVTAAGTVYCWGLNVGQLGDGTTTDRSLPVLVAGDVSFAAVSTGFRHTCAVTDAGAAYCWGLNSSAGQLGDGTETDRSSPVLVAGGLEVAAVSAGDFHTCGVTAAGAAYCWGANGDGQLGDGTTTSRSTPVRVAGDLSFAGVSAGGFHTCGVTVAGAAYCWGGNVGQLGDGTTTSQSGPVRVAGGESYAAVSAGFLHTCAVTPAGIAYCWGDNSQGQLGDGTTASRSSPVRVAGGVSFAAISAGGSGQALGYHSCGLTSAGAAYCWGQNARGQLGDGTRTNRSTPVPVVQ